MKLPAEFQEYSRCWLWTELCPPQNLYVEALTPNGIWTWGHWETIKFRGGHEGNALIRNTREVRLYWLGRLGRNQVSTNVSRCSGIYFQ